MGVVRGDGLGGGHKGLTTFNVEVRWNVGGGADSKEGIKSTVNRSAAKGERVTAFFKTKMPFAKHGGGVAIGLEKFGKGPLVGTNQGAPGPLSEVRTKRVFTGHESVA